MERTLIRDLKNAGGSDVLIRGRVDAVRKLGDVNFVIMADYTGTIQTVWDTEIHIKSGEIISIIGEVKEEPRAQGGFEIVGKEITDHIQLTEDLPIDLSKNKLNVQLPTLLDYRPLTLRHPRVRAIFKLYDLLLKSYDAAMRAEDFTEIKTPKILEAATEGGSNFFQIEYFDKEAFLAQSPQLYKQIMVGVFERVFEIGPAFRAEPHFTTRHVNEYISLDAEMGFITDYRDITATITRVLKHIRNMFEAEGKAQLELLGASLPVIPDEIPHIKLAEMRNIVKEKYGYDIPDTTDIDPEGERYASKYAKEEFNSDFIFLTHYPWSDRPFYTMPDSNNPKETTGFDLIYNGVELVTGSQRIHQYDALIQNMKKKGVSSEGLDFYLNVFKYAMPPHGGWAIGSERFIQLMLGLDSVKESTLFPRDVKRLSP